MIKYLFILLFCLASYCQAARKFGSILIQDEDGDSLLINADGSLNVTSTPSSDTAIVQLNGDTIPISVTDTIESKIIGYTGSTYQYPRLDKSTWSIQCISYEHHEIHSGSMYSVSVVDVDLDGGDTMSLTFKVPDTTKEIHIVVHASNSSKSIFKILEGPTVDTTTGTELTIYNRNGQSSNESILMHPNLLDTSIIVQNIGITDSGTVLDPIIIGTGKNKGSGETRGSLERICTQNTIYTFIIIGISDNGGASLEIVWYEHTPKE